MINFATDGNPVIEVKNLTKKFDDFVAVDNISFSVRAGEIFAFLGPNGAGKTTTIKMLTTLLKPTNGRMSVNGHNPVENQEEVRRSIGIVFQDPSLDDELTAYKNLEFFFPGGGLSDVDRIRYSPRTGKPKRTDENLQKTVARL